MKQFTVLVLVVGLLSAACGDGSATDTVPDTTVASPSTTVTTVAVTTTTSVPSTTTTTAPATTTTIAAGIVPGEDADVDAIVLAYEIAFDSVSDFETKAPYIDDPSGLEDTVALYLTTGEAMGGITVAVSEVVVDGATATLTYDLLFNNNPSYPDQTGRAVLTDAGWQVPRGAFCTLMASARVGCPDS
ncbi:MAG: hypothetical protein P1T08_06175 [Acidimicrobiia bacterium]|nr:hypothetical protein [Acidimicrobiia bacterium]